MSFDADEEILQDFLVEAGEILESLSEELVDLEQRPDDHDLLNSIFRGFHTVKGGAGFLQLNPLVDCCHAAENVFDTLRNGQRGVDSNLMDVVLQALDAVNDMFESVRSGQMPQDADPAIIERLHDLARPAEAEPAAPAEPPAQAEAPEPPPEQPAASPEGDSSGDITDDEFEQLLDALEDDPAAATAPPETEPSAADDFIDVDSGADSTDDEISEDEFEALLDQIHGKGKHSGAPVASDSAPAAPDDTPAQPETKAAEGDDLITDSEFEELLDRLHGKGQHAGSPAGGEAAQEQPVAPPPPPPSPKPENKPQPAAQAKPAPKPESKPDSKRADKEAHPVAEATVRVDTKRLDDIMNMVGELVLVRNRLMRLGLESADESMSRAVANLDVVTGDLQTSVMKTRMQPIKKVFGRFPRVVRDLARQLKKEINLELRGEDTDLDKNLVEALADPLVHLVRNAVDHGVEMPDEREKKGKSRVGTVVLSAEQEGDHILLVIQDDGGGMDADVLRRKAVEKGVMDQDAADRLTPTECYNLIFAPGFSTKEQISDVSGRGVGMDVVKTKITQLNGTINIDSELGRGTAIRIKVPLTLAIMPTLMVMLKEQAFAFPLVSVNEIFHLDLTQTNIVDGQEVVVVREKPIPLFHLKRWLIKGEEFSKADESAHVVVVSVGTQRVGFVVDQLIGQEEVVIKPLGRMLHGTAGMAGATITGDGRIALILDIPSMLGRYASRAMSAA
ncbi:chemotaxis protein CheA [Bacterioplanes sanyensis]|uniref:chemotaxis protein CheA n=1 Tax=Bacterioplanes sanyensis TaxID=1249553 RepID=UPI001676FCBD|nr:chemotaxis protein CheA [Bacterioplanes sanyensis]GGY39753.1 chemotaxis protein CheA [Bacterioplanes sanyensis]